MQDSPLPSKFLSQFRSQGNPDGKSYISENEIGEILVKTVNKFTEKAEDTNKRDFFQY